MSFWLSTKLKTSSSICFLARTTFTENDPWNDHTYYMGMDRDIRCYLKQIPCSSTPQLVIWNITLISFLEKWNKIFFKIYLTKFCPNVKGIHDHFVKFGQKCIFFMLFRRFFAWNKKIIKSLAILSQNYQNIRILRHVLGKHSRT